MPPDAANYNALPLAPVAQRNVTSAGASASSQPHPTVTPRLATHSSSGGIKLEDSLYHHQLAEPKTTQQHKLIPSSRGRKLPAAKSSPSAHTSPPKPLMTRLRQIVRSSNMTPVSSHQTPIHSETVSATPSSMDPSTPVGKVKASDGDDCNCGVCQRTRNPNPAAARESPAAPHHTTKFVLSGFKHPTNIKTTIPKGPKRLEDTKAQAETPPGRGSDSHTGGREQIALDPPSLGPPPTIHLGPPHTIYVGPPPTVPLGPSRTIHLVRTRGVSDVTGISKEGNQPDVVDGSDAAACGKRKRSFEVDEQQPASTKVKVELEDKGGSSPAPGSTSSDTRSSTLQEEDANCESDANSSSDCENEEDDASMTDHTELTEYTDSEVQDSGSDEEDNSSEGSDEDEDAESESESEDESMQSETNSERGHEYMDEDDECQCKFCIRARDEEAELMIWDSDQEADYESDAQDIEGHESDTSPNKITEGANTLVTKANTPVPTKLTATNLHKHSKALSDALPEERSQVSPCSPKDPAGVTTSPTEVPSSKIRDTPAPHDNSQTVIPSSAIVDPSDKATMLMKADEICNGSFRTEGVIDPQGAPVTSLATINATRTASNGHPHETPCQQLEVMRTYAKMVKFSRLGQLHMPLPAFEDAWVGDSEASRDCPNCAQARAILLSLGIHKNEVPGASSSEEAVIGDDAEPADPNLQTVLDGSSTWHEQTTNLLNRIKASREHHQTATSSHTNKVAELERQIKAIQEAADIKIATARAKVLHLEAHQAVRAGSHRRHLAELDAEVRTVKAKLLTDIEDVFTKMAENED